MKEKHNYPNKDISTILISHNNRYSSEYHIIFSFNNNKKKNMNQGQLFPRKKKV
jgi:hypothetical protein